MSGQDVKILNALGNETRLKMFKCLSNKDMHISKLAEEMEISVPVTSKHIQVLEDANLIRRKVFGKTHVLSVKNKNICRTDNDFHIKVDTSYLRILETVKTIKDLTSEKIEKD